MLLTHLFVGLKSHLEYGLYENLSISSMGISLNVIVILRIRTIEMWMENGLGIGKQRFKLCEITNLVFIFVLYIHMYVCMYISFGNWKNK